MDKWLQKIDKSRKMTIRKLLGEEKMMKYSIGEIANLLGISIVAVRNYEKCGLIEPERNEQNNYREYNAIDVNLIRRARSYMSYGFSLSEATNMLQREDLSGIAGALRGKEKSIEQRMIREYQLLQFTRQHAAYLERISCGEGECVIEMSPAFYGLLYRDGQQISEDKELQEKVRVWNDIRPFAETLITYGKDSFIRSEKLYQTGLCIEEQYASFFDIQAGEHICYYPARRSVHSIITHIFEPEQEEDYPRFKYVTDWMEQRGLRIAGDVFGRVLHTSKSTGKWLHHIEIWAPIE